MQEGLLVKMFEHQRVQKGASDAAKKDGGCNIGRRGDSEGGRGVSSDDEPTQKTQRYLRRRGSAAPRT